MLRRLTPAQRSLINYYIEHAKLAFVGLDAKDLPVFIMQDRRRTTTPFAIPPSTVRVGAVEPTLPLRWFTEEETDVIWPPDHELLTTLPQTIP